MTDPGKKLERNTDDKIIAGVASGVADYFGIDKTLVRAIWALTILLGGFGVLVYLILWVVLPEAGQDRTVADDLRDKVVESQESSDDSADSPEDSDETTS